MNMQVNPEPMIIKSAYCQLSAVERDFVDGYIKEIERRAGYANQPIDVFGKSIPADLYARARGLLDRALVLAAISERVRTIAEQSDLTPWRIMKELQNVAFANMGDYTSITANLSGQVERVIDLADCTPDMLAAIKTIKVKELPQGGRQIEVGLYDKLTALRTLMQMMGMLEPDNPYWSQLEQRRKQQIETAATIDATATEQEAGDRYQAVIEALN